MGSPPQLQPPQQPEPPAIITTDVALNERIVQRHDMNLGQEIFTTTTDKAKLVLTDALQKIEGRNAWQTPLGIGLTLGVARLTTKEFQDFLSISREAWPSVLNVGIAVCVVWLVRSLNRRTKAPTRDDIVNQLRKPAEQPRPSP